MRGLVAQFINFLHALGELHAEVIFATLFQLYSKKLAQTFLKTAWENVLENICPTRKEFLKRVRNFICEITLANTTCFQ